MYFGYTNIIEWKGGKLLFLTIFSEEYLGIIIIDNYNYYETEH